MNKMCLAGLVLLALNGCATQKEWQAEGGSRSDGTVRLAFEHGAFEKPVYEHQQGIALAAQKCAAWGYSGAEAFGTTESICVQPDPTIGCMRFRVTAEFQCTGTPAASK